MTPREVKLFALRLRSVLRTKRARESLAFLPFGVRDSRRPWRTGGCYILALALEHYFGQDRAKLWGLRDTARFMGPHEHVLVEIDGSGLLIDGRGVYRPEEIPIVFEGAVLEPFNRSVLMRSTAPEDGIRHLTLVLCDRLGCAPHGT